MPKPIIPPLNTEQFRLLISKHRTVFIDNLLGSHLYCLTHMLEGEAAPAVTLCDACEELVDLDVSRRGHHQYFSEKALVTYWAGKVGFALAAVMLSGHLDGQPNLDGPVEKSDRVRIRRLDTPPPAC